MSSGSDSPDETGWPARVRQMIEIGRLREQPPNPDQVAAIWKKAVESARMAFAGAAAFGYEGLEDLVPDSMEVRALRKGSMYDPVIAGPEDRDLALDWMRRTLPAIRDALAADPDLRPVLEAYP